ncbi:MAG TPA: ATP-grasp domain-containing protein, partial [Gaiellales bacterium]|nr:ATP-grasp domain-containing protein [Gaiellales bacterium]
FGSNDASAHIARILTERLHLPGPSREAFMRCHDKLASRRVQERAVPEATPRFAEIDPDRDYGPGEAPLPFPFFVKPVAAHLSQLAYAVHDEQELRDALAEARPRLDAITAFDRRLEGRSFRRMIAEELLDGRLVTFEGFMCRGRMTPIGVTDAVMHPNGISFLRWEYPSSVSPAESQAMADVAGRLMPALGFDHGVFNIEFFVEDGGGVRIVEVNGRTASQFAPLVRAVHGVSTYELALDLAAGGTPSLPPADPDMVAASFVVRRYQDAVVRSVPDVEAITRRFPHAHVELLVRPGQRLSDNDDDVVSHRLAVVALAAPDRDALLERYRTVERELEFGLDPVSAWTPRRR